MGGLLATRSHGDVWAWAAAKGHVSIRGPDAAIVVCVDTVAPVTTECSADARRVGHALLRNLHCYLGPCDVWPRVMFGSLALLQLGSVVDVSGLQGGGGPRL